MSLWSWAVRAYARPGAAQACLAMQDDNGQNVPLLLAAAWAADEGRVLPLDASVALTLDWETAVVGPLRGVRRELKVARTDVADQPREALRERVKAVELEAERILLDALEALAGPVGSTKAAPEPALSETAAAWAGLREISAPPAADIKNLTALICYDAPA